MTMPVTTSSTLSGQSLELGEVKPQGRFLNFDQFQVDLSREELFKDGARIRVPSKVYQVLLALLERPGEIVTRDVLRARLWPRGTFVNYDANVNTTVNKLRLALGDSPEKPVYVETIPRQGYCFLGDVGRSNEPAKRFAVLTIAAPEAADAVASGKASLRFARKIASARFAALFANGWGAAILLCGVLIGMGIVLLRHRPL